MAGLPPGDPQLVSMIVSHLKTQGLFDQFRRDCLADVDTKPAYLNLKQRVDNFVSNHLSNHTWSPHLNKNQLRNNIRQLVLQSGMLEQGVDRIVAQVVDPKVNHLFRPQVERVVREFLSPGSCSEEPPAPLPLPPIEIKPDSSIILEQASTSSPATTSARDAMSILDTITSLNQEASVWASSATDRGHRGQASDEGEQDMSMDEDGDMHQDNDGGITLEETEETTPEGQALEVKTEDPGEQLDQGKDGLIEEVKMEEEESGSQEQTEGEKDKASAGKATGKVTEEKQEDEDDLMKSTSSHARQKARERIKEEYFLEDSDLDGLSDITVSSVHTSDLSSFEGESENEELLSDSSEEGELSPDDPDEGAEKKEPDGEDRKPRRKAYVHKPFLYSRYYSDSDDEVTVEERRRSAAKDKEERLLKRQQNRERMEEKRKQKAVEEDYKKQKSGDSAGLDGPRAKEARKERKVLEKKMALNRKRKLDSRKDGDVSSKKKGDAEGSKKTEVKPTTSKTLQSKLIRNPSESASPDERHRRTSGSVSEDSTEARKHCDKGRTHSFILELEQGSQEALKQRSLGKFDRSSRKELHSKERREKERSLSDERAKPKQKPEKKSEHQAEDSQQKPGAKVSSEEKGEKRPKIKMEKKAPGTAREVRSSVSEGAADEVPKDSAVKKAKAVSVETVKAEKEKNREKDKDKGKDKEKAKGEKSSAKGDFKPLVRLDSAGSSEDRSDMEPGSDGSKKKDKHLKEVLKRSKSHSEDRPADKPKSKTDGTDTEKEKTKDQDGQKSNKSNSDVDKDSKRVKPVAAEKGRVVEKSKSKTKEETKTQQSSKTDKASSSEVKSTGTAAVAAASKPDMAREKRKEGSKSKIHEDPLHDKAEVKSAKKKLEKKNKDDERQEEEKKTETLSDRSSKTSDASEERQPKKRSLLQDTSTDSEPVATTLTTTTTTVTSSFSDDTCDALSDITPEPPEGETAARLSEMLPSVPAEADALLALMDVCTAAEARLPPDMTLQDADMKMKEAALTLLSMVPDSTVSSALVCPESSGQVTRPMEQREQLPSQTVEPVDEKPTPTDVSEASEKESEKANMSDSATPQEVDTTLNECPAPFNQDKAKGAEMAPETRADESVATPAAGKEAACVVVSETEKGSTAAVVSDSSKKVFEISSKQDLTEPAVADTETSPKEGDVVAEEAHSKMDVDNSEAESKTVEERNAGTGESDPKTVELDVPEKTDVIRETGAGVQSTLVKQISNVSSIDSQDDEKGSDLSEKEGKAGGRGGRKRKLSSQSVAAVKESGDERDENERKEGPPAEVVEVKTPRRGRSSRAGEEAEKDQAKESMEETASRGRRRSGAAAKEATADDQKKDGNKEEKSTDKSSSIKPADSKERCEEESEPRKSGRRGSQVNPPSPVPEDTEAAGSSDSKEAADTRKPAVKRKRSEDMEESVEETQTEERVQMDSQPEPSEEQTEIDSASQVEDQEEDKEDKPDDVDEELTQDDQETTPKRPGRRGRPSRGAVPAAAMEDPEKKAEEESEQNDEEEADDGDGKKGAAKRATTRAASRLEAEKNKPSKPSTRASRQSGKEETAAGTRGTRGQAAAAAAAAPKGGQRKREASPPAVRTRGGQKSEEPPSKRAKR